DGIAIVRPAATPDDLDRPRGVAVEDHVQLLTGKQLFGVHDAQGAARQIAGQQEALTALCVFDAAERMDDRFGARAVVKARKPPVIVPGRWHWPGELEELVVGFDELGFGSL